MATDIIARGMITEYIAGTNINFTENRDGTVEISASGSISSEDSVARDAIGNHKSDTSNPHNVTPAQIGLGNVDNTSDLDKPISTAVKQAIDNKADKTVATTSADGLMSAEDKGKLDGIATGANRTVIDTALSSTSINPVQNKVVTSALAGKAANSHTHSDYALKTIYENTSISLGRKADTTIGGYSVAEGQMTTASGLGSHAEGGFTIASVDGSHAEGWLSTASGHDAHAEGYETTASGSNSHSEGRKTVASGMFSHAEGDGTTASGESSHAGGKHTKALHNSEVAYGKYNESNDDTLFSIGDGTSDSARHNAFEITTTGGKLHDKDIATTDLIPTTLPANGGNADTVGEKSADDFTQIINFGGSQTDTKTAVGTSEKTTIYNCRNWTDFPTESPDGQGILIAANYNGSGIAGTDSMWVVQFFISARTGVVYKRYISNTTVYSWCAMYSADNKPYITGSFSGTATSFHFDYAPSFALVNDEGNIKFGDILVISVGGSERGYDVNFSGLSETTHEYIIFK